MKKKICAVTGSRAEYGLFRPLLEEIKKDKWCKLQVAVTGMHLSSAYGLTYKDILADGFRIDAGVNIPLNDDTSKGITKSLGRGVIGFASVFDRLRPDLVVLLGDRFETYSAAIASFLAKIPIAHIHGGELTEGAIDDAIRHSITKMSILHFASAEPYRRRIIQLGEEPSRVFNVGALGIDNIRRFKLLNRSELAEKLGFGLNGRILLVTFHPATLEDNTSRAQFREILAALDQFKDVRVIFTKPSLDISGKVISRLIDRYVKQNSGRATAFASLGSLRYLSLLKYVDVMLGNSSSGIIEMPYFGKPTINIGDRQRGRIMTKGIIQCEPKRACIIKALDKTLSFNARGICQKTPNPYGDGFAAKKIVSILRREMPAIKSLKKTFCDFGLPSKI